MMLDSLVFVRRKKSISTIPLYIGGSSGYGFGLGMFFNVTNAFNVDFECPSHNIDMFGFKYPPNSSLGDFLPLLS